MSGPDPTPVTGWRAWNLSAGTTPLLHPVSVDRGPWPPRETFEARCESASPFRRWWPHEAPARRCRCGIYAARSLKDLARPHLAWPPAAVVGTASLWGHVIEHDRGWRARAAYPDRLRLVCVLCAWFEHGPGEPVVMHAFGRRVFPLCDVHRTGIEVPDGRTSVPTGEEPRVLQARLLDTYAVDLLPLEAVELMFRLPATPEPPPFWPSIRVARHRARG